MIEKLLCTIDLGFGETGKVFGYFKKLTIIDLDVGQVKGLAKSPNLIKYQDEEVKLENGFIKLQNGTKYTIIKMYNKLIS